MPPLPSGAALRIAATREESIWHPRELLPSCRFSSAIKYSEKPKSVLPVRVAMMFNRPRSCKKSNTTTQGKP
jgi:hypothetical protein